MVKPKQKEIQKPDWFQEKIGAVVGYIRENRKRVYIGSGAALGIILIAVGWYFYRLDYEKNAEKLYTAAFMYYHFAPPGQENALQVIRMYREVVDKYPGSRGASQSLFSLGNVYYRLGDYDRAIQSYRDFLSEAGGKDGLKVLAYSGMGYCYEAKGEPAKALESYENASKNASGAFAGMTYANMARICLGMKDNAKALEYYRKALETKNDPLMEATIKRKLAELDS